MRLLEITFEGAVSALEMRKAKHGVPKGSVESTHKETRIGVAMSRAESFAKKNTHLISRTNPPARKQHSLLRTKNSDGHSSEILFWKLDLT